MKSSMTGQDKGDLLIQVTAREGLTVYSIYVRLRLTSNHQIQVRSLRHRHLYLRSMSFFKFSKRRPILKSMAIFYFLKSMSN